VPVWRVVAAEGGAAFLAGPQVNPVGADPSQGTLTRGEPPVNWTRVSIGNRLHKLSSADVVYALAFLIGISAGLRTFTAPAVASWAARLGWLKLTGTPLAFLGSAVTPWILTAAALFELGADKSSWIQSRKAAPSFAGRIISAVLCGLVLGASKQVNLFAAATAAVGGAIVGTLGGYEFRVRLTRAAGGRGFPIALLEDAITIGLAILAVRSL